MQIIAIIIPTCHSYQKKKLIRDFWFFISLCGFSDGAYFRFWAYKEEALEDDAVLNEFGPIILFKDDVAQKTILDVEETTSKTNSGMILGQEVEIVNQRKQMVNGIPNYDNFCPNSVSQVNKEGECSSQPRGSFSWISTVKEKRKSRAKKKKRGLRSSWFLAPKRSQGETSKRYADMEEEVIQNLTSVRRSSMKRTMFRRFK